MDSEIATELKTILLRKYYDRDPQLFRQFDGWAAIGNVDEQRLPFIAHGRPYEKCGFPLDADGDMLYGQNWTYELMVGADVRMLVSHDGARQRACQILRQCVSTLEAMPDEPWGKGAECALLGAKGCYPDMAEKTFDRRKRA